MDQPGGVFLRRADLMPPEDRTLLRAAARAIMEGARRSRTTWSTQLDAAPQLRRCGQARGRRTALRRSAAESAIDATHGSRRRRGRRCGSRTTLETCSTAVCAVLLTPVRPAAVNSLGDSPRRRDTSAVDERCRLTPLDERRRQSTLRVRRDRVRSGLHMVREQPRQPADAVAQRPGHATRPARRCSSATKRPGASGRRRRCPPVAGSRTPSGTARATPYTSTRATAWRRTLLLFVPPTTRSRSSGSRSATRPTARGSCSVTLYVEWVLGENRSRIGHCMSSPAATADRRPAGPQRIPPGVCRARGLSRSDDPGDRTRTRHRRSDRVHRPERDAARSRPRCGARFAVGPHRRRRWIPAGPFKSRSTLDAGQNATLVGLLGDAPDDAAARELICNATATRQPSTRRCSARRHVLGRPAGDDRSSGRRTGRST